VAYGRGAVELKKIDPAATLADVMHLRITLGQKHMGVCLVAGTPRTGKIDREYFSKKMNDAEYRKQFFLLVIGLGAGFWLEVAGEGKPIETFSTEDVLCEFTKADQWLHYAFTLEKKYSPEAKELSSENIAPAIMKEIDKLVLIYQHMRAVD
jgi:hypothetical protein